MRVPSPNPVYAIIAVRTVQVSLMSLAAHWLLHWPLTGPHALGFLVTPLLCLYFVFVFVAPWSWGLPILTRLRTRENVIALTFDDGPSPETTPLILDILQAHGVHATFFVLGERAEKCPDLLHRIVDEGHEIGLHGYAHRALTLAPWRTVRCDLERASQAVRSAAPHCPTPLWFRPPHGFKSLTLPWLVRRYGYRLAAWSLNSHDYQPRSAEQLTDAFRRQLSPGAIVLLHDGPANIVTLKALPLLLTTLTQRRYHCVTLPRPQR